MQRRDLMLSGGLSIAATVLAAAGTAGARASARMSAVEAANVRLVEKYLAAWDSPTVDIDKILTQYMAPDALIRWFDDEPTYSGREPAAAAAKKQAPRGVRVISKVLAVFVVRSLVVTSRIDTVKLPNKVDQVLKVAGVCVAKNGFIQKYVDYVTA